jgi:signal transduction histidine kinase
MRSAPRALRAIWLAVVFFCLCTAGVAGWLLVALERGADRAAARQAQALARGAETALNRSLLDVDLLLASLSELPALRVADGRLADPAAAAQVLRVLADQRLLVRDLVLLDGAGAVVASAAEATGRLGLALPAGFVDGVRAQPAPRLAVGVPMPSASAGDKVVHFARPLGAPGPGRLVALATVPVSELTTMLTPAVEIAGLWMALERDDGLLMASVPANDSLLGRRLVPADPGAAADAGGRAPHAPARPGRLDGAPSFSATRPTVYTSLKVTAGIAEAAAHAEVLGARRATVGVGVVFVAIGLALGALAQAWLTRLTAASAEATRARQTLEQALAAVEEGFLLWDADGRVVTWNERYLALFPHLRPVMRAGVGLDEIAEAAARAFLPHGSDAERRAWIAARRAARRHDGHAFEQRAPDGRVIATAERRTAGGGVVSIYRDVTQERLAAEELARARRAAEAANEAKTRFLATMSHEIRTPLNGVLGMNGLLLATPLDARQRQYAETIRRSGEGLLAIINEVLDMSRLEAGRLQLEPAPFDPVALVDEVVALLRPRATDKGIALSVEHARGGPARLVGDAGRIRQVLFNLAGNALKFTERGGVSVRTAQRARGDGRCDWTLAVHDSGIGIDAAALPTLFERFTQADSRISRHYGGSGLGLAISRELVELMGGRITVDSHVGEGSVFRVTLPLAVAAAPGTAMAGAAGAVHAADPAPPLPPPAPVATRAAAEALSDTANETATAAATEASSGASSGAATGSGLARATGAMPAEEPVASPTPALRPLRILVAEDNHVNQMLLTAMLAQLGHFADVVGNGREALNQVQQLHYDLVLMDIQMPEMDGEAAARAIRALPGAAGRVPIVAVSANVLPEQRAAYRAAGMDDLVTKPIDLAQLARSIASATA